MTSTEVPAQTIISLSDFRFLEAVADAYEAGLDADVSYRHDPVKCDRSGECVCPDLPQAPLDAIASAFGVVLRSVLSEEQAAEVGRLCVVGSTMAEALTEVGVRFR